MNDKNSLIGISLMVVLIVIYYAFFIPRMAQEQEAQAAQEAAIEQTQAQQEQIIAAEEEVLSQLDEEEADSIRNAQLTSQFGSFSNAMQGTEEIVTVTTDELTLQFNTKGGQLISATLNNHRTYDSLPLPIIANNEDNEFFFEFVAKGQNSAQAIRSSDLYFSPSDPNGLTLTGEESRELRLKASLDQGRYIEQVYTFRGNTFDLDYTINLVGLERVIKNNYYELFWRSNLPKTEKAIKPQRQKTQIVYLQGDDLERIGGMSDDPEEEYVKNGIDWISYKSQFFCHALMPATPINSAGLNMVTPDDETIARIMQANMEVTFEGENASNTFTMYLGPNEYYSLRSYKVGLEDQMDLGYLFISWINKLTIWVFKQMEKVIPNYGIIILLFAIMIKLLVFPMTYKSYVSMAKLRVLNETDEMKALKEKYKDDAQKLQMETMAKYREMGVSPFGGCLPMLLQYPILISMFFFFPQSVELRQKSFLWADDLSTYDSILDLPFSIPAYGDHISLFTLLMAVSIYVYTYFQQKSQPTNQAMPFMKYLPYFMPIIFVFFLNNYASGLSWYYFAANIISIIQTTGIRASMNDEKMLAQMHANAQAKKKSKGKGNKKGKGGGSSSAGKSRLEKWMEKQQAKQEDMKKQRSKQNGTNRRSRRGK